jgi:SAM-dependent methyltransferase
VSTYALLPSASANRVYGHTALQLVAAELRFIGRELLGGAVAEVTEARLGGVDYLMVDCGDCSLDAISLAAVSNVSALHALFEVRDDALVPVGIAPRALVDEDITTIQRYVGKTNEQFTHLLINVTLAASSGAFARLLDDLPVRLLDPLCGRGTSLNQAVVYGLDAYGIEIDKTAFEAYTQFIGTWLKDKGLKHHLERAHLKRGREAPARRVSITYGRKGSETRHVLDVVQDDTVNAAYHVKRRSIDVVVADLPYGVQHANRAGPGRPSRSPDELLQAALPVWVELLRPGGAIGLSWNRRTLDRARLHELVVSAGLRPRMAPDDQSFVHRVDRAITRDLLVATI